MSNKHRRRLLIELAEHASQDEVNVHVSTVVTTEVEDRKSMKIHMLHTHLPKLEKAGFIEWDRDQNVVRTGPQFERIRPVVKLLSEHADEFPNNEH
ncbi:DUF7344 domain-containing protein [Halocatena marina]|uniref:ArsR family transcriptional regulator n=1 Tax=Halocatena marina TaxID=2934937 RepID=A0ABD5YPM0_9EURY|nr:transcriptional regulator [Halocatena marina]